ncbi:MAG: class I SAM-dependent methyltransferase, partial [Ignavibacteriales bacterium]|nr:class I SAM-dependent methyltransferase [Ignavibacteriales bacterium]
MKDYFKAGHFYSPIVSYEDIKKREHNLWGRRTIPILNGVNLNVEQQLHLAKEFALYYSEMPFEDREQGHLRYYFENDSYSYMDAIILYSVMRHFQPRKIIEVG